MEFRLDLVYSSRSFMGRKRKNRNAIEVEVNVDELNRIIDASASGPLDEEQRDKLRKTLELLIDQIDPEFRNSEKLSKLVDEMMGKAQLDKDSGQKNDEKKKGEGGNGRTPATKITGAQTVEVPHPELNRGDQCPSCEKGKVYPKEPEILVRFKGAVPVQATKYMLGRLRCNLCGQTYTAEPPKGVGSKRYDESVASILGLLIYGGGLPRHRLAGLQGKLGVPLAQSTQWELLDEAADEFQPVFEELIRQAAQGEVLHSDDTSRNILKLERPAGDTRTGVFTSGIISAAGTGGEAPQIALFFTGRQHAGENLNDVLRHRVEGLDAPIAMHDAESKNASKVKRADLEVELANCLPHGRRYFVDNLKNFPEECYHVLQELCIVFHNEKVAKEEQMTPEARLAYHQTHSQPVMDRLKKWLQEQISKKLVEPNSGLGKAINYMLNHWPKLTLFLRKAGAPLDNNLAERSLKKTILHRKNSLFYRTQRGADVGDRFTSIIHTCELNGINPFDYMTALLRNSHRAKESPERWMPWAYTANLQPVTEA